MMKMTLTFFTTFVLLFTNMALAECRSEYRIAQAEGRVRLFVGLIAIIIDSQTDNSVSSDEYKGRQLNGALKGVQAAEVLDLLDQLYRGEQGVLDSFMREIKYSSLYAALYSCYISDGILKTMIPQALLNANETRLLCQPEGHLEDKKGLVDIVLSYYLKFGPEQRQECFDEFAKRSFHWQQRM